jgi:hypothetical protein
MPALGEMTLTGAADLAAGNWKRFEDFAWHHPPEVVDLDSWALIYTHNRDSDILARCNAVDISEALAPFAEAEEPDVVFETHSHWACGHVDGFAIRVRRPNGDITEAFQTYHALAERLADYPVLDEERLSRMEAEESEQGWHDWARDEFARALEARFRVPVRDGADLRPVFDQGEPEWYAESSGMTCDIRRVVKNLSFEDVRAVLDCDLLPERIEQLQRLLDALRRSPEFHRILGAAGLGSVNFFGLADDVDTLANLRDK